MVLPQFYRTSILLGDDTLDKLQHTHVLVAGVGGVGGQVVEALVRAGIGKITIVDNDIVDITNINRQLIATLSVVGQTKVSLFEKRIKDINPQCEVKALNIFLDNENVSFIVPPQIDYVIDCIDTVKSKIALIQFCVRNKIKIISSMGAGNRYDVSQVKIADISKTKSCSLARVIRNKLKQLGIIKGVKVVFSEERGRKPLEQKGQGLRPINGTISFLPPLFGLMLSGFVLKQIIDKELK
jgi:tRNA A37 threonylcarbamoyladenosine dehydratase